MTLIVCIEPDRNPILLADCLFSSPVGDPSFELPTVGTRHADLPSVTGLRAATAGKKIVQINGTMFVAFAGHVARAHTAIRRLRDLFRDQTPSKDYLKTVLMGSFGDVLSSDVSLMIVLRNEDRVGFVPVNCQQIRLPGVGKVWVAGSGVGDLRDFSEQMAAPLRDCLAHPNRHDGLIACALLIAGCMLGNEVWAGGTLVNSFGGFYEVADCTGTTFIFFTDYVFVFWQFPAGNDAPPLATKVMKRLPRQDPSEYVSIDLPASNSGPVSNERQYQVATGADGPAIPPTIEPTNLNSRFQVNVFGVNIGTRKFGTSARIHRAEIHSDHAIYFARVGTTLTRQIRLHYLREYCDGLLPLARELAGQSPSYNLQWPPT